MIVLHEEYLVDTEGHKKAVVVPIDEWEQILEQLEELDDIEAYDTAKADKSESITFDLVLEHLQSGTL